MLTLDEISLAFKKCNSESNRTFKDYLLRKNFSPEEYQNGIILNNSFNYILSDIEKLLDKAIINICSADYLLRMGFFHWGFVSSYYSNFFSIQALNRLQLNFHVWVESNIICILKNYVTQELELKKTDKSTNSHEVQFNQYFSNYSHFKGKKAIDRFWNLGLGSSPDGRETSLRNDINYLISKEYYYELDIKLHTFKKITLDNGKSPFEHAPSVIDPKNYSLNNLKLGMCRIRMLVYILNYVANRNIEYRTYFVRNMKRRKENINTRYFYLGRWNKELLDDWLKYVDLELSIDGISANP